MSTLKVKGKGKFNARTRRHLRVRKRISGTTVRPRLVVNRSARHMFVQVVDDTQSRTLAYASTMEADVRALEGSGGDPPGGHGHAVRAQHAVACLSALMEREVRDRTDAVRDP